MCFKWVNLYRSITGGTACDLTELERQTEVRFVCAPAAGLYTFNPVDS
jgi:hypothetical protein